VQSNHEVHRNDLIELRLLAAAAAAAVITEEGQRGRLSQ